MWEKPPLKDTTALLERQADMEIKSEAIGESLREIDKAMESSKQKEVRKRKYDFPAAHRTLLRHMRHGLVGQIYWLEEYMARVQKALAGKGWQLQADRRDQPQQTLTGCKESLMWLKEKQKEEIDPTRSRFQADLQAGVPKWQAKRWEKRRERAAQKRINTSSWYSHTSDEPSNQDGPQHMEMQNKDQNDWEWGNGWWQSSGWQHYGRGKSTHGQKDWHLGESGRGHSRDRGDKSEPTTLTLKSMSPQRQRARKNRDIRKSKFDDYKDLKKIHRSRSRKRKSRGDRDSESSRKSSRSRSLKKRKKDSRNDQKTYSRVEQGITSKAGAKVITFKTPKRCEIVAGVQAKGSAGSSTDAWGQKTAAPWHNVSLNHPTPNKHTLDHPNSIIIIIINTDSHLDQRLGNTTIEKDGNGGGKSPEIF